LARLLTLFSKFIFVSCGLLVAFSGCIRWKPARPLVLPPLSLENFITCEEVVHQEESPEPAGNKAVFARGEESRACAFLRFENIRGEHYLVWKWYGPKGRLYRASDEVRIGEADNYFEKFMAWDNIFLSEDKEPGQWKVAVFLDGKFLESRSFEVK
jgi:hypothetical protein